MSKEIRLTKGQVALVDDDMFDHLNNFKWRATKRRSGDYYAICGSRKLKQIMHETILGKIKGFEIDHINGRSLDNQRHNLRHCTRQQNQFNRGPQANNEIGHKGVVLLKLPPLLRPQRKPRKEYEAKVCFNGKHITCGRFFTAEEAARAYDSLAKKLIGDFAWLNFPMDQEKAA